MVNAIWSELGLRYPPAVEKLPRQSRCLADATRLSIRLPEQFAPWCLLHELAHSLTSTHDGVSDLHGPRFMSVYLRLLTQYLRLDPDMLSMSARAARVRVASQSTPIFIDPCADSMTQPFRGL